MTVQPTTKEEVKQMLVVESEVDERSAACLSFIDEIRRSKLKPMQSTSVPNVFGQIAICKHCKKKPQITISERRTTIRCCGFVVARIDAFYACLAWNRDNRLKLKQTDE